MVSCRHQLVVGRDRSVICCDFAAVQCALSTLAIASMVSPGGCQSQSFFDLTLEPSPSYRGVYLRERFTAHEVPKKSVLL
jgi:hypothetical protein